MFHIVIVIITNIITVFLWYVIGDDYSSRQGLGIHEAVLEFEISPNDMPGISRYLEAPMGSRLLETLNFCGAGLKSV